MYKVNEVKDALTDGAIMYIKHRVGKWIDIIRRNEIIKRSDSNEQFEFFYNEVESEKSFPISEEMAKDIGKNVAVGVIDRVPPTILNSDLKIMEDFYNSFIENISDNFDPSILLAAGLNNIEAHIGKEEEK